MFLIYLSLESVNMIISKRMPEELSYLFFKLEFYYIWVLVSTIFQFQVKYFIFLFIFYFFYIVIYKRWTFIDDKLLLFESKKDLVSLHLHRDHSLVHRRKPKLYNNSGLQFEEFGILINYPAEKYRLYEKNNDNEKMKVDFR